MALVFQYGSNCSSKVINAEARLRGDAKLYSIAETVDDYELVFQAGSENRDWMASHIVTTPGETVWGVIWDIPDFLISRQESGSRKSLDAIEAEGTNYIRTTIPIYVRSGPDFGERKVALTYLAKNPKDGPTDLEYVTKIIQGLKEHDIPQTYIDKVKHAAKKSNPALEPDIDRALTANAVECNQ